jgi:hypothetical protein
MDAPSAMIWARALERIALLAAERSERVLQYRKVDLS